MIYHKLLEISNNQPQAMWLCATGLSDGVTTLAPGLWYYPVTIKGDPYGFDTTTITNIRDYNTVRYAVNSVSVGADDYTEVSDFADLTTQDKSFYFDDSHSESMRVYVHFENFEPPNTIGLIYLGLSINFSMTSDPDGYVTETGIFYSPRVSSISEIVEEVDPLFFGITKNPTVRVELLNHELSQLDDMGKSNLFGNPAEILLVPDGQTYANAEKIFTGRVSNVPRVGQDIIEIELQNERSFLTRQMPVNFYTNTDSGSSYYYSGLDDKYNGKPTPLIFGKVKGIPCIPLDKTGSTYTFQVCETDISDTVTRDIYAITKVYDEDGTDITANITADLTAGTFTVSETYVEDSSNLMKIYADVSGYEDTDGRLIENGLEIIRLMLLAFYGYSYTGSVYNLTEWAAAETNAYNLGYYIDDVITMREAIEDLSASLLGNFIIQGDGLITFRKRNISANADYYIAKKNNFTEEAADYDAEQFVSSATVKHSRDWGEKEFRSITNTDYQEDVYARYRLYRPQIFETYINNSTHAAAFASVITAWKKDINPTFSATTPLDFRDVKLNDIALAEMKRAGGGFYGNIRTWVRRRGINLNDDSMRFILEYVDDVDLIESDNIDPYVISSSNEYVLDSNGQKIIRESGVEWAAL